VDVQGSTAGTTYLGNACVGIALFGAHDNRVEGNTAANLAQFNGAGVTASGNGNPAQCLDVARS
jgi:parallel beta-helix repeat protein